MKKVVMLFVMLCSVGSVNAEPVSGLLGVAIQAFTPLSIGYIAGVSDGKPIPACYSEPSRKVTWANNPNGYGFNVSGCDYEAKKDQLVIAK